MICEGCHGYDKQGMEELLTVAQRVSGMQDKVFLRGV